MMLSILSMHAVNVTLITDKGYNNPAMIQKLQNNLAALLTEINAAYVENRNLNLSGVAIHVPTAGEADVKDELATLWDMTHFKCNKEEVRERCWTLKNGTFYVRQIPMTLDPDGEVKKEGAYQEVSVSFDRHGNISEFRFAIDANVGESMEKCGSVVDVERRAIILGFVERFRTAYCRKDINFMNQIFSDDAIIVTGTVIHTRPNDLGSSNTKVVYNRQNKQRYLANLRRAFARNKYIDVKFDVIDDDCAVTQSQNNPNVYGVRLRQEWRSSNYSDEGYVFLLWDFRDENHPEIRVRTWQPDRTDKKDLFSIDEAEGMIN